MVKISYTRIKTRFFRESQREKKQVAFYYLILKIFCKIRQKIECSFLPSALISQFGLDKYRTEHIWG